MGLRPAVGGQTVGVNYAKLDAALAAAVETTTDPLEVFVVIGAPPDHDGLTLLRSLGVHGPVPESGVLTVTAGPEEVAALADRRWVTVLRLSRRRHPT